MKKKIDLVEVDKDGFAIFKKNKRTVDSTLDIHERGGYRTGWNRTYDTSQKPAAERLTELAKKILRGEG